MRLSAEQPQSGPRIDAFSLLASGTSFRDTPSV
jgi:hypothetical protein